MVLVTMAVVAVSITLLRCVASYTTSLGGYSSVIHMLALGIAGSMLLSIVMDTDHRS